MMDRRDPPRRLTQCREIARSVLSHEFAVNQKANPEALQTLAYMPINRLQVLVRQGRFVKDTSALLQHYGQHDLLGRLENALGALAMTERFTSADLAALDQCHVR